MRGSSKWLLGLVGGAAALLLLAVGTAHVLDSRIDSVDLQELAPSPALIVRGEYLARLGDCAACHSVAGRPPFSGGLRMQIPIGAIYTTNITPDPVHGIGSFSLSDFDRALRYGVARGHSLYPAMPYPSYASTRPDDVAALYAFFKHGVAPAPIASPKNELVFPLSMRFPLSFWRWMFASDVHPFEPVGSTPQAVARGAYFVQGLGHCGECHTPRGLALQLKAIRPGDGPLFLSGAPIEGYFAPSLRSGAPGTLSDWSVSELADFLRTGANDRGIAFGSMSDVIDHSTQYLSASDAVDAATFLKSLVDAGPTGQAYRYDQGTRDTLRSGGASARGAQLYLDNCAACHRPDGKGYPRVFPALAGNPVVRAPDASNLISIVLKGSETPRTSATPAQFSMPSFAWRLSDSEVADVVSFIRDGWGNGAAPVAAPSVAALR